MEEEYQNPYYPITDHQRYPSFPPENGEVHAQSGQNVDLQFQHHQLQYQCDQLQIQNEQVQSQYNQLQMQHNDLQTRHGNLQSQHNGLQSKYNLLYLHVRRDPITLARVHHSLSQIRGASFFKRDNEHEAPAENTAPAEITAPVGVHRYITRSTQKTQPVVMGEPVEDDHSNLTPDREYTPSSAGSSDEEMDDEDYEPTPKPVARPVARPATVAHHEFAYCEVLMTREELYHVRGNNYVAPQILSTPDKNDNIEDHKRLRITWAERERLNAWRVRHGRKPHEIREGTKNATTRELWYASSVHSSR